MFARPVAEFDSLRTGTRAATSNLGDLGGGVDRLGPIGDLADIAAVARVGASGKLTLTLPGVDIGFDSARKLLTCNGVTAPLMPVDRTIKLRVLVDRGSVEVFANDGRAAISRGLGDRSRSDRFLVGKSEGEGTGFRSIEVNTLGSSWR